MNYFPAVFKDVMFDSWTIELFVMKLEGASHAQTKGLGGHLEVNMFRSQLLS